MAVSTVSKLTGAFEDRLFSISYSLLKALANESATTQSFVITSPLAGASLYLATAVDGQDNTDLQIIYNAGSNNWTYDSHTGVLSISSTGVYIGGTQISSTGSVKWLNPTTTNSLGYTDGLSGPLGAFTISENTSADGTGTTSGSAVVTVQVSAVNDAPFFAVGENAPNAVLTNGVEDTAVTLSYSDIMTALGVRGTNWNDVDTATVSIRIAAINTTNTLELTKGGVAVTANATTGTLLSAGETLSWKGKADLNGILSAFDIRLFDGTTNSATSLTVSVNTAAVNDAPVLSEASTEALSYVEGATSVINGDITLTDVDSVTDTQNMTGATVSIATGFVNGQDLDRKSVV